MLSYTEVEGDLIVLAKAKKFDVIAHGCNCRSTMGAGIAVPMAKTFGCDKFPMELEGPSIKKLGNIDYQSFCIGDNGEVKSDDPRLLLHRLWVVNAYTQNWYGKNHHNGYRAPVDYEAITLCMRKINDGFKRLRIGLPKIGAGLAGGDWNRIKEIIKTELVDCHIIVVNYKI